MQKRSVNSVIATSTLIFSLALGAEPVKFSFSTAASHAIELVPPIRLPLGMLIISSDRPTLRLNQYALSLLDPDLEGAGLDWTLDPGATEVTLSYREPISVEVIDALATQTEKCLGSIGHPSNREKFIETVTGRAKLDIGEVYQGVLISSTYDMLNSFQNENECAPHEPINDPVFSLCLRNILGSITGRPTNAGYPMRMYDITNFFLGTRDFYFGAKGLYPISRRKELQTIFGQRIRRSGVSQDELNEISAVRYATYFDFAQALYQTKKRPVDLMARISEYCPDQDLELLVDELVEPLDLPSCLVAKNLDFVITKINAEELVLTVHKNF